MKPPNMEPTEIASLREWAASYGTDETVPIATVTLRRLLDALDEANGALSLACDDVTRLSGEHDRVMAILKRLRPRVDEIEGAEDEMAISYNELDEAVFARNVRGHK